MAMVEDIYNLERFVRAQEHVYPRVCDELRAGSKQSHWMWFIFPQIAGLGHSAMSRRYAIASRGEAAAYLAHPLLGPRLRDCARLVDAVNGKDITAIMGSPDDTKLQSSMTLFSLSTKDNADFVAVLEKYYGGAQDSATIERLS